VFGEFRREEHLASGATLQIRTGVDWRHRQEGRGPGGRVHRHHRSRAAPGGRGALGLRGASLRRCRQRRAWRAESIGEPTGHVRRQPFVAVGQRQAAALRPPKRSDPFLELVSEGDGGL